MKKILMSSFVLLASSPAWAQQVNVETTCWEATFDFGSAVFSADGGFYDEYTIDPVDIGAGATLDIVRIGKPSFATEFVEIIGFDGALFSNVNIADSTTDDMDSTDPAGTVDFLQRGSWQVSNSIRLGESCPIVSVTVGAGTGGSFAADTIQASPGFGTVIDSGPTRFATDFIEGNLESMAQEADDEGCTTTEWAGTWVRQRSPRLQGETADGRTVSGPSITNGMVDGVGFSASLASGGRLTGSTDAGNELRGRFARLNSARSIWYGVEIDCDVD